jgi:NADH-quinone oxidoreductase subunit A
VLSNSFSFKYILVSESNFSILGLLILIALILSVCLFFFVYFFGFRGLTLEKLVPYECGFEAFDDSQMQFNVRFYLLGILFIIFDLEIVFLFPWLTVIFDFGVFGISLMLFFFLVLCVGFAYEWLSGALDWD